MLGAGSTFSIRLPRSRFETPTRRVAPAAQ
jgi:hypothetical protein